MANEMLIEMAQKNSVLVEEISEFFLHAACGWEQADGKKKENKNTLNNAYAKNIEGPRWYSGASLHIKYTSNHNESVGAHRLTRRPLTRLECRLQHAAALGPLLCDVISIAQFCQHPIGI